MSNIRYTVTTAGQLIFGSDAGRVQATMTNDSSTRIVYLSQGSQAAAGNGVRLNPGQSWSTTDTSSIYAIVYASGVSYSYDTSTAYVIGSSS